MLTILRLILFVLSSLGTCELLRRKLRIHVCFLPALAIASQTSLLILGGLLNVLQEMTWLLFFVGIAGLVYVLWKERNLKFLKNYLHVGFLFLGVMSVILLIFVYGKVFSHYDNFSHWALVVKQMLITGRFPNFQDAVIEFKDYPLGSASYIFFFSRIVSGSEPVQMFAQIYMMLACMMPLFVFTRRRQVWAFLAVLCGANFFLIYNVSVTNLLVDTLLPLAAMCSFVYAWMYGRSYSPALYGIAAFLVFLVQVKNVGLYFAAFILIGLLIGMKKDRHILARLTVFLLPFLYIFLWKRHCSYVFSNAMTSKHAMSMEYYASVAGDKTPEQMRSIAGDLLHFTLTWPDVWAVFGMLLLTGVIVWVLAKRKRRLYIRFAVFSVVMFVLYQVGLLGMYIFSMPMAEAAYLAEVQRYTKSVLIAVLYLTVLMLLRTMEDTEFAKAGPVAISVFAIGSFLGIMIVSFGELRVVVEYRDDPSEREWIEEAMEEYEIEPGSSYCIIPRQEDGAYSYYLGMFLFDSPYVDEVYVNEEKDMDDIWTRYVFLFDEDNPFVRDWVNENYPEQAGHSVIVIQQ